MITLRCTYTWRRHLKYPLCLFIEESSLRSSIVRYLQCTLDLEPPRLLCHDLRTVTATECFDLRCQVTQPPKRWAERTGTCEGSFGVVAWKDRYACPSSVHPISKPKSLVPSGLVRPQTCHPRDWGPNVQASSRIETCLKVWMLKEHSWPKCRI